ncbi:hypothetical protein K7432_012448 [Basidiobolus ranarum]|uniref:NADPH--hemoprotein reductase n=1 Tax=Basidiobolus ranarum TaxID=34480 RepID=A0ABR2VS69_9FUNG
MVYKSDEIPGPKPHMLMGNIQDIIPDLIGNFRRLHDEYGPVMRISLGGHELVSICDPDIINSISGEGDFTKEIYGVYEDLAILNGRGLVTTATKDPDWVLAHKLLMPAFSARAMKAYHETMGKCILDLIKIMDSFEKSGEAVDMSRWMISLALESIGVIGFGYNFNLLDDKDSERHPFSVALNYVQSMIMKRSNSVTWTKWLQTTANVRFRRDLATLRGTVDDVLSQRRKNPPAEDARKDLLDFMLAAESKEGEKLDDHLIRDEIITFLSAGHNTTSSFLSWTFFELARNPDVEKKMLQEIVNAGIKPGEIPSQEQVAQCKYTDMVIKESLRYHPPIPMVLKYCQNDCTIKSSEGKEYEIKRGQLCQVQIASVHKDPKLWKDPNAFNPERFGSEQDADRHPCAWIPFSDGPRACIGRQFSLQEGKLALIMLLSKFRFRLEDENKEVGYQIIVSVKPVDLTMKVLPAELPSPNEHENIPSKDSSDKPANNAHTEKIAPGYAKFPLPPVTFLYGTQTGTSEEYARKLSGQAKEFGFTEVAVAELDDWDMIGKDKVPSSKEQKSPSDEDGVQVSQLAVIVTATYNGYPPDNALKFDKWLTDTTKDQKNQMEGLLYAVFGCGNKQWQSTFQAFPTKVDTSIELLGAERLVPAGVGNADDDIDADFTNWSASFWAALMQKYGRGASDKEADLMSTSGPVADPSKDFTLEFLPLGKDKAAMEAARANRNYDPDSLVTIRENRELQNVEESGRSTRHIEVEFPSANSDSGAPLYRAGDHLEIRPSNDEQLVEDVAIGFGFALDSVFQIKDCQIVNLSPRSLGANIVGPCTIKNALTYYADLLGPPTRYTLTIMAKQLQKTRPDVAERLQAALQPGKETPRLKEFLATHRTILDIQRAFKIKELSFKEFLSSVNVMVPRRYSISSSPLEHPKQVSVTVGIVKDLGGPDNNTIYEGLASGYLMRCPVGTKIDARIKPCKNNFRLPEDENIPVIFICAGTGYSPFRGFLQERHAKGWKSKEKGGSSDAYLFFGCRHPNHDYIYKDELDAYVEDGTLTQLHTTFSRYNQTKKYVQHLLLTNAELLYTLITKHSAHVYVCGAGKGMASDVRRTFERLAVQVAGMSEPEAVEGITHLVETERYNEDVWG